MPARFLFSYVVPLAPLMFAWDGIVSAIRTYTHQELLELAPKTAGAGYEWDAGRFEIKGPYGWMPITYLVGMPVKTG